MMCGVLFVVVGDGAVAVGVVVLVVLLRCLLFVVCWLLFVGCCL